MSAGVPLHLTYGMTETASQIATSARLRSLEADVSAGKVLPGREVRISPGGEIQVRGEVLPRGILTAQGLQPATDAEGWFSTGDAGRFDSSQNLIISGRLNRMFISGGENICPESIEGLLMSFPEVRRAVVVGIPDQEFGARPVAFIAGEADAGSLRAFLRSRMEGFAVPDLFLPWPTDVPEDDAKVHFDLFNRLAQKARL
jgi:O-succinylbenzoic acid--CoA ligase